jgi:RND family efflux transporter MFP subunit
MNVLESLEIATPRRKAERRSDGETEGRRDFSDSTDQTPSISPSLCLSVALLAAAALAAPVRAADVEGFTQPFQEIDVPAADTGVIEELLVAEGERVAAGQLVGKLDCELLTATLEIADASRNALGRKQSAEAELRLQADRLEKLRQLLQEGHASQEEVDRTAVAREVAEAELLSVIEDLKVRELEHRRILVQIEQRMLRSPIDGVVARIHKDAGEFVAPNDPVILRIVQLDPLLAVFAVPARAAENLDAGAEAVVSVGNRSARHTGVIETLSPVIDAQSGTLEVKVRLPNPDGALRSGERCILHLAAPPVPTRTTAAPLPLSR